LQIEQNKDATGQSSGQTDDVQDAVEFVSSQQSECEYEVIKYHGSGFSPAAGQKKRPV